MVGLPEDYILVIGPFVQRVAQTFKKMEVNAWFLPEDIVQQLYSSGIISRGLVVQFTLKKCDIKLGVFYYSGWLFIQSLLFAVLWYGGGIQQYIA